MSDDEAMAALAAAHEFESLCMSLEAWVQRGEGVELMTSSMREIASLARARGWYPTTIIKALHATTCYPAVAGADSDPFLSGRYTQALRIMLRTYFEHAEL